MGVKMEQEETERGYSADRGVKELQAQLFPINTLQFPKVLYNPGSFLGNFLLKTNQLDLSEDSPGTGGLSKLREQRELIALCRDLPSYQAQLPRWPTECQVLDERVEHIIYNPSTPEPFYLPTGKEVQPKPLGDEFGVVVFQYHPVTAINYFSRSCVGGCKSNPSTPLTLEDDDLRFESRFESGNLAKAVKLTATFYELHLRTDMYTNRHTQWFYFRITNVKRHILYRFSIVNLSKGDSLYNSGMKPLMYSTKDAKLHSIGWRRCGDNIVYFCNENGTSDDEPSTYTLTFTIEFPHDKDTVYLAHSYPYTYSDLQEYLNAMVTHPIKSMFCTLRLLCKSLAGNNIYYVTITTPQTANEKKKRAIVITARVHPGETPSSWMMKGFLDFLTGDSSPARELRDKFIFKLVPMINPDGVIVGNSRCSLTGRDLNRQYRTVIRETYPPIWHIKLMIRRLIEECGVAMYCDLHAHSRQNDIFIYGCENRRNYDRHLHEQVFPLMLHKNAADKFSFESCKFRVQRCKEGAGRVVMWMMGISNSYTMEASFAGSDLGPRADTHFSVQDYEQMGKAFCQTLLDFYDEGPTKEKLRVKIIKRLLKEGSTADEPTNITLSDYSSDEGDSSSSEEEGGGHHNYSTPPNVPPTSPVIQSPVKIVPQKKKIPPLTKQNVVKSPTTQRKPLQMYQATLGLSLADDCDDSSSKDSNSDYESPRTNLDKRPKPSRLTRRQKTRKGNKICEHSDTEIQIKKHSRKRLNVLELIPAEKMRSQSWNRSAGFPQSRTISHMDGRVSQNTTKQLAEVQAKLLSLRHRLWTGMNDGDNLPISWGFTSYSSHDIPRYIVDYLKLVKALMKTYYSEGRPKNEKKKKTVLEKSNGNKNKKKTNRIKDDTRKSPKKKQNGIKRQKAVDLGMCDVPPTIYYKNNEIYKVEIRVDKKRNDKKGKSLDVPNTQENEETTNQDDTTKKKKSKKKKKYKNKWQKKVSEKIVPVKMQSVD